MKTLTMNCNKPALKKFKKGWMSCYPDQSNPGFYKVIVNKEQYEAMDGNEFDPWEE